MPKSDSRADYLVLRGDAQVIEADGYGEKVLLRTDGSYLKLFRRKRRISSAAWYPYARRFADNAARLSQLGIPCPRVLAVYRFPDIQRDVVHYQPLPGDTLRQIIRRPMGDADAHALRDQLGRFVARLHEQGVFFRSIHLGNVVRTEEGHLGLIDFADMKILRRPLSDSQRQRNFAHLLRYREDGLWLLADSGTAFAQAYTAVSKKGMQASDIRACLQSRL